MSAEVLDQIMKEIETLSPDEQLRLAEVLLEKARQHAPASPPRRKWSEIRGIAAPSLFGEDAQVYISRTRREADEQRERQWRREP
ncbi:MAG: hypothetical protein HY259_05710 [Chloroflexi bacterium]|nr:hypothetical protein [Chloroflexota bacterium]MBI3732938.1 hypothetical protein [Chloroflexota bacterium]